MEAVNNHTDFPVLIPRTATPPQGPGQSASESEGSVAPKAASSWTLHMLPGSANYCHSISICSLQL